MKKITEFNLKEGDILVGKYEIMGKLGSGWEGEVYKIRERSSGIERTAKLFFPHKNVRGRSSKFYAKKLHKLRQCQVLIHYHNEEALYIDGQPVVVLISEYVEGELLSAFINRFPGKRLTTFQALHMLYALTKGIEEIHLFDEYHGDLHTDNVVVNRFGLEFKVKLLDMFHWGRPTKANRDFDVLSLIRIFHESLGGAKRYAQLPNEVKHICCGLKASLIRKRFRTISMLREHIEKMRWHQYSHQ